MRVFSLFVLIFLVGEVHASCEVQEKPSKKFEATTEGRLNSVENKIKSYRKDHEEVDSHLAACLDFSRFLVGTRIFFKARKFVYHLLDGKVLGLSSSN